MTVANVNVALQADPRLARLSRIKPQPVPADPGDLVRLTLARNAFVYQRLSSHEQKRKSIWSIEMQEALADQARADGYRDDQIAVERRDLGISGTKGAEHRPGLAEMIARIEAGEVEAVYTVHISRLTRDQTLIDGLELAQVFKRHNVVLVLPTMRLNLRDAMHMRLYRQEIERAADEIELLKLRLGGPKRHKALSGRWDGRGVPLGYVVDMRDDSPTSERYVSYEPHAAVVRTIFQAVIEHRTPTLAARALRQQGTIIPDFPPTMTADHSRGSVIRSTKPLRVPGGFAIAPSLIRSIVTNPVYLGFWLVNGDVVRQDNHAAIIEQETFWQAQERLLGGPAASRVRSGEIQMLAGLICCARHDLPRRMTSVRIRRGDASGRYQCGGDFDNGQADHFCTVLDARLLDEPIADVMLNRCSFAEHADAVLGEIQAEHDAAEQQARQHRRTLTRLEQEIATLKENLAITKTPDQAALLFEMIDQRKAQMQQLADARNSPVGRMLTAAQVSTVRRFLADLRSGWDKQPTALKNELLRLLLARVTVDGGSDRILVTISWRSGDEQHLEIERPVGMRGGKQRWTEEEKAWLRRHYPTASAADLRARFPLRHQTAVRKMAESLGLKRDRSQVQTWGQGTAWTETENEVLRRYVAGEISLKELFAELPNRTWDGIVAQRKKLGLPSRVERIHYRLVEKGARAIVTSEGPPRTTSSPSAGRAAPSRFQPMS